MSIIVAVIFTAMSPPAAMLAPGLFTNEEEVYFDQEAKRTPAPWIGIVINDVGKIDFVDRFGDPARPIPYKEVTDDTFMDPNHHLTMTLANGRKTKLLQARGFTCWGAALKTAKKPDGSENWFGAAKLKVHDQGGRVRFGGGDTGAPETILRMRNVIWPSGPNRPSLVLYVHTPDAPDRAVSYSWADKDAKTVGINLRWMQASCTLDAPS